MSYIDTIRNTRTPVKSEDLVGHVWVNLLIAYSVKTGEAKVIRSFTRPAKESVIKSLEKKGKDFESVKINFDKSKKVEDLFEDDN